MLPIYDGPDVSEAPGKPGDHPLKGKRIYIPPMAYGSAQAFASAFRAIGLEACPQFAQMAAEDSTCEIWQQDFLRLALPDARFDGIFANASLFHIPSRELPRVLRQLHATLKPDGVLFSSNPRGANEEGWNNGRYGVYHDVESWRRYLAAAGFVELEHYYRPPGLPREQQPWLASVWRRQR